MYHKLKLCSINHVHYTLYICDKTLLKFSNFETYLGENIAKGAMGAKVKVLFQGLHITHLIRVLVYSFKFCILDTQLSIAC
jgi:hypothetical protein